MIENSYIKIKDASIVIALQTLHSYNDCLEMFSNEINKGSIEVKNILDKKGYWIPTKGFFKETFYSCSICKNNKHYYKFNYCPDCGAQMIK